MSSNGCLRQLSGQTGKHQELYDGKMVYHNLRKERPQIYILIAVLIFIKHKGSVHKAYSEKHNAYFLSYGHANYREKYL